MTPAALKDAFSPFAHAAATFTVDAVGDEIPRLFADDALIRMCHPFGDLVGHAAYLETCYQPLVQAMPDLERRDMIVLAGPTPEGAQWIACMGNYMGTFQQSFLGIPPTGHLAHMRYHEFFRVEDGKVMELQAIWDIPELMVQANAWPMAPQLGAHLCTPGPMSCDGLHVEGDGEVAYEHVTAMLTDMCKYPADPDPAVMRLEKYWHPRCNWYGPTGIGSARGIQGFRNWHQIPFLKAMPDRKLDAMGDLKSDWIAQGDYVCETGWPNMRLTLSGDGWMGIPPVNKEVLLRSLDFWRLEAGLIRENWVLVDLLHLYHQLGVDVLGRVSDFNKARGNVATAKHSIKAA